MQVNIDEVAKLIGQQQLEILSLTSQVQALASQLASVAGEHGELRPSALPDSAAAAPEQSTPVKTDA